MVLSHLHLSKLELHIVVAIKWWEISFGRREQNTMANEQLFNLLKKGSSVWYSIGEKIRIPYQITLTSPGSTSPG